MTDRIKKFGAAGTLLHLVSFGLVAAGVAISFGFVSFSLLGISRETLVGSRIGESAIEFIDPRSAVAPYTEGHEGSVAAAAIPPSLVEAKIPLPSPVQNPPTSDTPPEEPGSRSNFDSPPDHKASATTQDTWHGSATRVPPTDETRPPELSESQQAGTEPAPLADVVSAPLNASPATMATKPIVDEERDRLFQVFQIRNAEPTRLDQAKIASHETAPAEQGQNTRSYSYDHPPSSKAAFRYRVRKECGPINDPELRRDCIASFSSHYPWNRR
jgi:hypothetical protein